MSPWLGRSDNPLPAFATLDKVTFSSLTFTLLTVFYGQGYMWGNFFISQFHRKGVVLTTVTSWKWAAIKTANNFRDALRAYV